MSSQPPHSHGSDLHVVTPLTLEEFLLLLIVILVLQKILTQLSSGLCRSQIGGMRSGSLHFSFHAASLSTGRVRVLGPEAVETGGAATGDSFIVRSGVVGRMSTNMSSPNSTMLGKARTV